MKVFLSWSGPRSKAVARALREWLPSVIQALEPWMSEEDIQKGARWFAVIGAQLEETRVGIICLTPENMSSPWLLFEAGALSKTLEETYVCPYLLDLRPADVTGPLAQFQLTQANEEDTRKLLHTVNGAQGDKALDTELVDKVFDKWWPELETALANVPPPEEEVEHRRTQEEMLGEVLELVRSQERVLGVLASGARLGAYWSTREPHEVPLDSLLLEWAAEVVKSADKPLSRRRAEKLKRLRTALQLELAQGVAFTPPLPWPDEPREENGEDTG